MSKQNERIADVEVARATSYRRLEEHSDHLKQQDKDIQQLVEANQKKFQTLQDLNAQPMDQT